MKAEDLKAEDLIKGGWPEKNAREVATAINGVVAAAVAEEREACAQLADSFDRRKMSGSDGSLISHAIRARGQREERPVS